MRPVAERIVINTGPLVALAHAGATSIAARLPCEFLAPLEVQEELDKGIASGLDAVDVGWVHFRPLEGLIERFLKALGE